MKHLPNVTLIAIDCVNLERVLLAADISTKEITFGKVKILSSIKSNDPRVIPIEHIPSTEAYSEFMIKELHKYIDTDFAITFQYDGFIFNLDAWTDEFLKYDYIGAPWYHLGDLHVGNGGFSLRSKRLINWLAENWQTVGARIHPEDVFISKFVRPLVEKIGMQYAPVELAAQFSKEGNEHSVVWNGEFGFHGIKYTDISRWLDKHPEYKKELTYEIDDYATLMKKYPIYDGSVHSLKFGKYELKNYKTISEGKKNYEVRVTKEKYYNFMDIIQGNTLVFKRSGVAFKDFPIPAYERILKSIEHFNSLKDFREKYPTLSITPPVKNLSKWKIIASRFTGDYFFPIEVGYTVFWF